MQLAISPYLRLMRLHQPVGIWLLLWPCWWAIALASPGWPSLRLLLLFGLGAVLMRGAGCIINDMADRRFDRQVERTRQRPLASGELGMIQAAVLLTLLLVASAIIAAALGKIVFLWAALSLPLVATYPFMKRITWWPQLFLGLTFNWGALAGWAAVRGTVELPALFLYLGGIFWTLGYDTVYAHQDKKDDARIGVRSSALRLGGHTKRAVGVFYLLALGFWLLAGWNVGSGLLFFMAFLFAELQMGWQICKINIDDPDSCRRVFLSNAALGWLVFAGCLAAHL
ncbi:MAG: 4-hydroxybenzoate octaprenyltransferase [Pseudomonadota bacterium]|nr:4-hydroxybenzoate octaprenyltransferase [Pseudomonadota bacterium]